MSSQMDVRRARAPDEHDELEGLNEEEEGVSQSDILIIRHKTLIRTVVH